MLCSASTARLATDLPDGHDLVDLGLYQLRGFDGRERLFQLVADGLERDFPRPRTIAAAPHNLPAPAASFVGREAECRKVHKLLDHHRLVNVVGPGGAGKTRLALEVARDLVPNFHDGVWFVDLAAITDPYLVAVAVAEVLGVRPEPGRPIMETLAEYVGSRNLLLFLDTCDAHLQAVTPFVTRLLAAGPGVRVLATSREPIGAPGELVWRIPPMAVTAPRRRQHAGRGGAAGRPGRGGPRRAGGRPGGDAAPAAGGPAPRRPAAGPGAGGRPAAAVLGRPAGRPARRPARHAGRGERPDRRVQHRDHRPAPAQHASGPPSTGPTGRCRPSAAALLRKLSVFAGPIDLSAVEWFAGTSSIDLAILVDKSLVIVDPGPTKADVSYRLLHPIKAFAARALVSAGEETDARDRHLEWALRVVNNVHTDAEGKPVTLSTYPLDQLAAEVRACLSWSVSAGRIRDGLRLAVQLDDWWRERGLAREGRLWLHRLLEKLPATGEEVPATELATAYQVFARHAGADGEYGDQLRLLVQAEEAAWRSGQASMIARVSASRGEALAALGREDEAERACRDVIDWAKARHVQSEALPAVFTLAQLLWRRGALAEAASELGAARAAASTHPTERGRRSIDMLLGLVALSRGDLIAAHDHIAVALRFRMTHGYHWAACEALTAMAVRCALGGEMTQAATLFGASQAARARLRSHQSAIGPMGQRHESAVRHIMGDAAFDAAYGEGAAMTLAEATAYALAVEHPDLRQALVRLSVDTDPTADLSLPTF